MHSQLRRPALALALLWALLAPAGAGAISKKDLWATVNVCDTVAAPNVIGIRGNMPGNGRPERRYMRFEAQWFSRARQRWLRTGSSSRWIPVGNGRRKAAQAGFSFQFQEPPAGSPFVTRGVVQFRWRAKRGRRWPIVRRATRITRSGIAGVAGGDPEGRSDAVCVIRP